MEKENEMETSLYRIGGLGLRAVFVCMRTGLYEDFRIPNVVLDRYFAKRSSSITITVGSYRTLPGYNLGFSPSGGGL